MKTNVHEIPIYNKIRVEKNVANHAGAHHSVLWIDPSKTTD